MDGDERGVTPVISTILLVAVVVVLASVVSAAVWASLAADTGERQLSDHRIVLTEDSVTISHLAGESIPLSELRVVVRNTTEDVRYTPTTANLSDASDASFDPGETWSRSHPLTVQSDGHIQAFLIHEPSGSLLASRYASNKSLGTTTLTPTSTPTTTAATTTTTTTTSTTTATTTTSTATTTTTTTTTTSQPPSFSGSQTASSNSVSGNEATEVTFSFTISNPSGQDYSLEFIVQNQDGSSTTEGPVVKPSSPRTVAGGSAFPTKMTGNNYLDVTIILYDSAGTQVNSCSGRISKTSETITLTC